ncbi:hypothetical protein PsorP6_014580 [Peronosclerospora sorghi]|uniref:Uncharacterized protein n=1 Tax=Peronosclerospora sorghi TaxID=230839 RepID=A0ACC0VTX1_9STRA|nr:hypothetical protein PsorP6_014580 [Peronosclerospora sorghi]
MKSQFQAKRGLVRSVVEVELFTKRNIAIQIPEKWTCGHTVIESMKHEALKKCEDAVVNEVSQ